MARDTPMNADFVSLADSEQREAKSLHTISGVPNNHRNKRAAVIPHNRRAGSGASKKAWINRHNRRVSRRVLNGRA